MFIMHLLNVVQCAQNKKGLTLMKSFRYIITFKIEYYAIVLGGPIISDEYEKLSHDAGLSASAASYEISDYYAKYIRTFESDINTLLAFTQDADPYMDVSCDVNLSGSDGFIYLAFDNVANTHLVQQALKYIQDFLKHYTNDVVPAYDYEPVNVCAVATGSNNAFCKLDNMYEELFNTWDDYGVDKYDLLDCDYDQQYLVRVFEDTEVNEEKCMAALNEFEIDNEAKRKLKNQYEEILRLLKEAQSEFSGLKYQTENNEQCFMAPSYTILRVFFDEIEIEEN